MRTFSPPRCASATIFSSASIFAPVSLAHHPRARVNNRQSTSDTDPTIKSTQKVARFPLSRLGGLDGCDRVPPASAPPPAMSLSLSASSLSCTACCRPTSNSSSWSLRSASDTWLPGLHAHSPVAQEYTFRVFEYNEANSRTLKQCGGPETVEMAAMYGKIRNSVT